MKSETKHYIWKITLTICGTIALFLFVCFYLFEMVKESALKEKLYKQMLERTQKVSANDNSEQIVSGRSIFLYQAINENTVGSVISSLLELSKDKKEINLYINVSTGYYDDTFALIGVINSLHSKVNTIVTGESSSTGTVLLCSATGKRTATPNSIITVYIPGLEDLKADGEMALLRAKRNRSYWQRDKRFKLPPAWFEKKEEKYHYLSASDALKYGLIDVVKDKK